MDKLWHSGCSSIPAAPCTTCGPRPDSAAALSHGTSDRILNHVSQRGGTTATPPITNNPPQLGARMEGLAVKKVHAFPKSIPPGKKRDVHPSNDLLVFCEKTTGAAQFCSESNGTPDGALERMASLLAMQCLVRGQEPDDFAVLVPAEKSFSSRLVARAQELLAIGRSAATPASLSARQRQILHSVICQRANKEIASQFNITVRTVKFHISSLLSKFGVENRTELARRAAVFLRPAALRGDSLDFEQLPEPSRLPEPRALAANSGLHTANKVPRSVRFPGRVLTA